MKHLIGLGLICTAVACGGGDGGDRVDAFIGTWTYDMAATTSTLDCDDNSLDGTDMLMGTFMFKAGTSSDLEDVDSEATADCPALKFNVDGSKASAVAGQKCTQTDQGTTSVVMINSYTMTLDSAGTKGTIAGAASLAVTGGATINCTISLTGSATKAAARTADAPLMSTLRGVTVGLAE